MVKIAKYSVIVAASYAIKVLHDLQRSLLKQAEPVSFDCFVLLCM